MPGPISEILSTTLKNWVSDNGYDNIFKTHALWWKLLKRKGIKGFAGGERLVAPLEYAKNTTGGAIGKAAKVDLTEQDVITSAEYNWALYAKSVVLFDYDLDRNRGEHQMVNLLEAKARNAIASMREDILTDTFATAQKVGGVLNWQSLFRDTGTIGGVDPTTDTYWKAKYDNTAEALTPEDMYDIYNQAGGGSDNPDMAVMPRVLYQKYNSSLQTQQRFSNAEMAGHGFETLRFHNADVIWDEQAIADEVWFANTKYLYLGALPEMTKSFKVTPFEPMTSNGQLGQVSLVSFMGQYVLTNRRRLGALDGRTVG